MQKAQVIWVISRRWGEPTIPAQSPAKNAWYKHICWRHWQATCMLELTQGCRTGQIQTHCPTNITQGISAHPAAYFPEINRYWKNTRHLERSKCFPNLQKGEESEPSNFRPIALTCVLCKFFEHSVASSLAKHFTELDIFYEMQQGFWEKRSCETQLIM